MIFQGTRIKPSTSFTKIPCWFVRKKKKHELRAAVFWYQHVTTISIDYQPCRFLTKIMENSGCETRFYRSSLRLVTFSNYLHSEKEISRFYSRAVAQQHPKAWTSVKRWAGKVHCTEEFSLKYGIRNWVCSQIGALNCILQPLTSIWTRRPSRSQTEKNGIWFSVLGIVPQGPQGWFVEPNVVLWCHCASDREETDRYFRIWVQYSQFVIFGTQA